MDPVLAREQRLLDERRGGRAAGADLVDVGTHLHEPADEPERRADDEQGAQRTQRRGRGREGPAHQRRRRAAFARSFQRQRGGGAQHAADDAPQQSQAERAARRGRHVGDVAVAAEDGEGEHEQAERQSHHGGPRDPGGRPGALGAPELPARRPRDRADRDGEEDHRGEAPGRRAQRPGVDHRRQQRADGLAQALGQQPTVAPDDAEDRGIWRDQRDEQARDEHDRGGRQRGEPGGGHTGDGQVAHEQARELSGLGIDPRDALAQRLGAAGASRRLGGCRAREARARARAERLGRYGLRRGWCRAGGRGGDRLGVGDQEVLLPRAAGRAEPRARADALAAVGAIARLGPAISVPSAALRALAARGGITSRRWTAGEPCVACSRPFWWRPASLPLLARARRGPEPAGGDAQDPARLRRLGLHGGRRRRRHAEDRRRAGRRRRPARLAAAVDPGRAARVRRDQALAADRARVPRLEPRAPDRPAGPRRRPSSRSARSRRRAAPRSPTRSSARPRTSGASGPRTIILVSDGKDTCQPPSPCQVAQRIAKGGVEMRIQAIGFNVDTSARRELQCIAKAGGGVYTDADNAATLKEQLRVLSTRALRQYVPRGKPVRGGPSARQATTLVPGRYVDAHAARQRALVRRRAAPRRDAEGERVVHPAQARHRRPRRARTRQPRHRHAELRHPRPPELLLHRIPLPAARLRGRLRGRVAPDRRGRRRPIPTRASPSPGATTSSSRSRTPTPRTSSTRPAGSPTRSSWRSRCSGATAARPRRRRGRRPRSSGPTPAGVASPNEPPATALLVLVGGGLAALGFAGGVALRRRRAG